MKFYIIANPNAGKKNLNLKEIASARLPGGSEWKIVYTRAKGHATELTHEAMAGGWKNIIAAGGDGTIREVAVSLLGTDFNFGVIPCGSGNGLARNIAVPLDIAGAFGALAGYSPKPIDIGVANGRMFTCSAGVGIDAKIAHDFNTLSKRRGIFPYVWYGVKNYFSAPEQIIKAVADGKEYELNGIVTTVMNGVQYGGGARLAPEAVIDDGFLDLCSIKRMSVLRTVPLLGDFFSGNINRHKDIYTHVRAEAVTFICPGPQWYHLDGEDYFADDGVVKVTVRHKALNVLRP